MDTKDNNKVQAVAITKIMTLDSALAGLRQYADTTERKRLLHNALEKLYEDKQDKNFVRYMYERLLGEKQDAVHVRTNK